MHCSTSSAPREHCAADESRGVVCSTPRMNAFTTQIQAWFENSAPRLLILLYKQQNMRGENPCCEYETQQWCLLNNCRLQKNVSDYSHLRRSALYAVHPTELYGMGMAELILHLCNRSRLVLMSFSYARHSAILPFCLKINICLCKGFFFFGNHSHLERKCCEINSQCRV